MVGSEICSETLLEIASGSPLSPTIVPWCAMPSYRSKMRQYRAFDYRENSSERGYSSLVCPVVESTLIYLKSQWFHVQRLIDIA